MLENGYEPDFSKIMKKITLFEGIKTPFQYRYNTAPAKHSLHSNNWLNPLSFFVTI